MKETINFLLAGVGGQGTILASDVLVNIGLAAGFQAKQAEVHGMSQRGGSVTSFVRWGRVVHSPLVGAGEVDVLLSFEKLEALRSIHQLHHDAIVVINDQIIKPLTAISGDQKYPPDEVIEDAFTSISTHVEFIVGDRIARDLGNERVANVVLLGALSVLMEQNEIIRSNLTSDTWMAVISEYVPEKYLELNQRAFQAGRNAIITG